MFKFSSSNHLLLQSILHFLLKFWNHFWNYFLAFFKVSYCTVDVLYCPSLPSFSFVFLMKLAKDNRIWGTWRYSMLRTINFLYWRNILWELQQHLLKTPVNILVYYKFSCFSTCLLTLSLHYCKDLAMSHDGRRVLLHV